MEDVGFLDRQRFRSADSQPIREATLGTLNLDAIARHIERATRLGRYTGPPTPHEYLLDRRYVVAVEDQLYATLAAVVCFGHNPQAVFTNAVVDLGHYRGNEAVSFEVLHLEKSIGGTLFDQLQRVEDYLWRNTHHGMTLSERGYERVEIHEYPQAAIREVGVNMLAHRDYLLLSAARVLLFNDRIEWYSPGGLPPGVTPENVLRAQEPRNPLILSILYEAGWVEAFGQGLDTVVRVLRDAHMDAPRFDDIGAAFIVTVRGQKEPPASTGTYIPYTSVQQRIIDLLRERTEVSFSEIRDALPDRAQRTIQLDIQSLADANIVERIGQTKATRYRLR